VSRAVAHAVEPPAEASRAATIRRAVPGDARAIATVRIDAWRTTYAGIVPAAYLAAMSVDDNAAQWHRILAAGPNTTSIFVADDGGEIAGFSCGNMLPEQKHGFDAELTAIYLRRDRQRAGLGRRLVGAVAAAQREHGATGLLTWVFAANRDARAFYERLGAELVLEQPFQWDGLDLVEAGYGWRQIDPLLAACALPRDR
jgi:GNAT superfamily N-acetyltransferase